MVPYPGDNRRKNLNIGDILHLVQIAVLLISLGIGYEKMQMTQDKVSLHSGQLDRMEHYLSSKDPDYWKIVKDQ